MTSSCVGWRPGRLLRALAGLLAAFAICALFGAATAAELSLREAVELSLEHSFGVKAARYDSLAANMAYRAANARRFPEITLTARSTFKDEVSAFDIDIPPLKITREIGSKEAYQADLELSQPFFTGGRLTNGIRVERENSLAKAAALRAREMAAAYECRRVYLEAMLAASAAASARASAERLEIISRDAANRFREGLADSIDLLDAAMAVEQANQVLMEEEVARDVSMARLRILVGLRPDETLTLTESLGVPVRDRIGAASEEPQRPEVEELTHLARAADYAASATRAGYFPTLGGFATYSLGKPNQDLFGDDWNDYLMVGLRLSWSLNLANRTGSSAAAGVHKARSMRAAREDLLDDFRAARETALEQMRSAYHTWERSARQLDLARRKFALALQRQEAGMLSVNRLLEMEAELAAIEHKHHSSLIGYYLAETRYLYATGSSEIFGGL